MMHAGVLALIMMVTTAGAAQAGPWLREEKTGFLSTTGGVTQNNDMSGSLYAEYGLTAATTIGASVFYGIDRTLQQAGSAIVFLRRALSAPDATQKWAWHLGFGARSQNYTVTPAVEAGLSWGRGIQVGERYGWAVIDGSVNVPRSPLETRIKLDGTIGLGFTDRFKGMAQVFLTHEDGEVFGKFAPSLLFTPRESKQTFQLSVEFPFMGGGDAEIKIGLWREF
ncbi:hypothetical protein [uncultured Roseobacter sp.]|uniref:hypothetical protein n=1 Tax=uncultured Roseobacter sp. TaxID=114847 RepID=UPI002632ADEE|nr:hypothetical protein [uncultured Roseobacter sp.]